jgi:hypothetical protein
LSEETLDVTSYKCRAVFSVASGAPIVFMHGFSYTSGVWQRISVIGLLTSKRLSFLALDMPYGLKSECRPKTHDTETNVNVTQSRTERFRLQSASGCGRQHRRADGFKLCGAFSRKRFFASRAK